MYSEVTLTRLDGAGALGQHLDHDFRRAPKCGRGDLCRRSLFFMVLCLAGVGAWLVVAFTRYRRYFRRVESVHSTKKVGSLYALPNEQVQRLDDEALLGTQVIRSRLVRYFL